MNGKLIIFSAPSGSGKTTIVKALIEMFPHLEFSISATSRPPRGAEQNGVDYYFMNSDEFDKAIENQLFVEYEEVYSGTKYGTLKSEIERIWATGATIIFDVDVMGGMRLKEIFGARALSVFVMPPSVEELESRLLGRKTEPLDVIARRLAKAEQELAYADRFDVVVVNDNLQKAIAEVAKIVERFIG